MSAERSTESIIDLLYGELSEEQEREMRAELAESPDLQAEFDEFDTMLGRVRDAMPLQEVSPNIHASILEAARVAAEQPADDRLIRRGAPEKPGFWKRVSGGQGSQIALVAAVLLAGLFTVRYLEKSDSPLHAPASDLSAMREAAPAAPAMTKGAGAEEDTLAEGEAAMAPVEQAEEEPGEAIADQWSPDDAPGDGVIGGEAADETKSIEKSLRNELAKTRDYEPRQANDRGTAQPPAPKPEPTAAAKSASEAKPTPRRRKTRAKKKKESSNQMQVLEDSVDDDVFGSTSTTTKSGGGVQGKGALEAVQEEAEPAEYRPAPGSISEVDTYFRRGDWNGAVKAADQFLAKGSGSSSETASAMFIKAQSLSKLGRSSQAERLLQQIKKNYPGWNSAQVEQQLSELQRKTAPKKQKRKAQPKMDKSPEQPAEVDMFGE